MNIVSSRQDFLPLRLSQDATDTAAPAGLQLADAALLAFNLELHDLRGDAPLVGAAQLAGLAQWLQALPADTAAATIELRLARAESLRRMLDDADWSLPAGLAQRARRLLAYIERCDDLIPDDVPLLGHLDDALLVELSWSEFSGEVQDYLDYRRWCSHERVRGSAEDRRNAWETDCLAEAGALLHRQEVRSRGYARVELLCEPFRVR
jgi:uncharacterized membrane protein YkvA (DUF1232 family)